MLSLHQVQTCFFSQKCLLSVVLPFSKLAKQQENMKNQVIYICGDVAAPEGSICHRSLQKPTTNEEKLQILGAEHTMAVLSCNPVVYLPIYLFLNHWLVRAKGQTIIFENLFKDYKHSSLFSSSPLSLSGFCMHCSRATFMNK